MIKHCKFLHSVLFYMEEMGEVFLGHGNCLATIDVCANYHK